MFIIYASICERDAGFPAIMSYVRDSRKQYLRLPSLYTNIIELVHTSFAFSLWRHVVKSQKLNRETRIILC
jgi:hypothetical protein